MSAAMATIFKKLSASETNALLQDLHTQRGTVLFKFVDSGVFRMKAAPKGWGQSILAARPATLADSRRDQIVTGNFMMRGQMYFFNAKVRLQRRQLHLQLTGELQKLARRKKERFVVPASVPLHFLSKRVGEKILFFRGVLQDLSITGCRIAVISAQADVKVGSTITGLLRFGNRKPITISGVIRHQKRFTKGRYDQLFGIELQKCDDLLRLQGWIVDVQREAFSLK